MNKYTSLERLKWLKLIEPNFKLKEWHYNNVERPEDIKNFNLYRNPKRYTSSICPQDIIGIDYGFGYNWSKKINWLELFYNLKRLEWVIDNFKNKEDLLNHIHHNKSVKFVEKYGDKYITKSGQHRLCLAKLLEIPKIEVEVDELQILQ